MIHKHENTEVRQQQIVEAARKLIVKYGSEHLTVRRIAEQVDISEAAIYRHFRSKKQILAFLVDRIEHDWLSDLPDSLAISERTRLETLDYALRHHLSAIEQRRGISFQIIAEILSLGDKTLNKRVTHTIDKYLGRLGDLLTEAVKAGEVRDDIDVGAAALLLFGMIQGLVTVWALSNYDFDPQQKYATLWGIFRQAVAKR